MRSRSSGFKKKPWFTGEREMAISLLNRTVSDNARDLHQELLDKVKQHRARVVVIGAGYVGLTLAVEAARVGFPVSCYEIDPERVKAFAQGKSELPNGSAEELLALQQSGRLTCSSQAEMLQQTDVIVICVATPLNAAREPDTSQIEAASRCIRRYLRAGTLVILESTSYPGTTEELVRPILEGSGLRAELDFWLAFSPERVDPGNETYGLRNTPKVVAGLGPDSTSLTEAFYAQMVDQVIKVSSPAAAEMVKLYENIFRNINIAFANEMALLCDRMGLDIWEIIDAAASKPYGFMPFYPGPGPGGHCIPIDPHYLAWKAHQYNFHCKFIELASTINDEMPRHVCTKITEALNQLGKPVKESRILILGAAYKPDIGDVRESPIFKVLPLLVKKGAQVNYHDPYVPVLEMSNPGRHEPVRLTTEVLQQADCVVILTDHACYPYHLIAEHASLIVDCKNALGKRGIIGRGNVVCL